MITFHALANKAQHRLGRAPKAGDEQPKGFPGFGPQNRAAPLAQVMLRPGFTLLEVMLASLLGLMVVIVAMGLFSTLAASDRRSNENYHRQMELSLAHQTVERSLRGLLMDNTLYPRPPANAVAGRRDSKPLTEADGAAAVETPPPTGKRPRLILEADTRLPPAMKYEDAKGVIEYITPQRLEIAMIRPPVYAPPTAEELVEARYNDRVDRAAAGQHRRARPHETDRRSGGRSGSGSARSPLNSRGNASSNSRSGSSSSTRPSNDQLADLARRAGVNPDALAAATGTNGADANQDPAAAAEDEALEPALAPGLRAVFEIRWDPDVPRGQTSRSAASSNIDESQGSWSLWWRPVRDIEVLLRDAGEPVPDYLTASEQLLSDGSPASDLARGSVMLASNLQTCRWEMVRTGETTDTFQATWQDELPAYCTLEMRTRSGLWMKWMFEVDWTRGGEPGEPVTGANTPTTVPGNINNLNQPGGPGNRPGNNTINGNGKGSPRSSSRSSGIRNDGP
ncbi:MAG: hypothetical protein H7210_02100 [Pyrinomonadaceae bacterium]|nr:hypothetical protein [Phycisphaerales bacterium]